MKSQRTLEIDELTECEVNDQSEAMAKWLAITLTEKMFRGKEWIYYKKRVESKQMTIFDYLEV